MPEVDLVALKQDILRVIEAGANRDEMNRLEREIRVVFDRAASVPMLISAKEKRRHEASAMRGALQALVDIEDGSAAMGWSEAFDLARAALLKASPEQSE